MLPSGGNRASSSRVHAVRLPLGRSWHRPERRRFVEQKVIERRRRGRGAAQGAPAAAGDAGGRLSPQHGGGRLGALSRIERYHKRVNVQPRDARCSTNGLTAATPSITELAR